MNPPPRSRKRNRRGEGQRLRDEIVDAATRLIDGAGPETITLRGVAREAGISAPSIYGHFEDADAIMDAVVERFLAQLEAHIRAATDQHAEPVARLMAGCGAYLTFSERYPQRYAVLFRHERPRPAREARAVSDGAARPFETLIEGIGDCVAAGRSSSTDPFGDATALWSALHGYATLRATVPQFPWPERDDMLSRMVHGLAHLV